METYPHERVELTAQLPALIAVLDKQSIKQNFPSGAFIPAHWHRSLEITLIENAEVILRVGNNEYIIKDNFTCINSGEVHSIHAKKNMEIPDNAHSIILIISYDFIIQYCPEFENIRFELPINNPNTALKELFYKLETLYNNNDKYNSLTITACILEILNLLLTKYQTSSSVPIPKAKGQKQIKQILTYLHENYQEELTLESLASHFHISKEYLSRQFHRYVGSTFRDYLIGYRLYHAYEDIIHSNRTIQEIAQLHGFANVKSLIHTFKEAYGDTPYQYRQNYKSSDK